MAYFACGSSMSTSVAPRAVSVSSAALKAATMPASTPLSMSRQGTPIRVPRTSPVSAD